MSTTRQSLSITRGDDRTWSITIQSNGVPMDLTGVVAKSTIRKEYSTAVVGHPTVQVESAVNGRLALKVDKQLSSLLKVQTGKPRASYVFDVVLTLNGKEITFINGYLIVEERVSPTGA